MAKLKKQSAARSAAKKYNVVLGVTGGIACYKACELARILIQSECNVHVVMTRSAQQFVMPLTFQALTGNPVATELLDLGQESRIGHIRLADLADLIVIAPTTADFLARLAQGRADDILTSVVLASKAPILLCPSMNVNMWNHPATQANLERVKSYGYAAIEPGEGYLACGWIGKGRLPDPEIIALEVIERLKKGGRKKTPQLTG